MSETGNSVAGIVSEKVAQYTITVAARQRYFEVSPMPGESVAKPIIRRDLWYYFRRFAVA